MYKYVIHQKRFGIHLRYNRKLFNPPLVLNYKQVTVAIFKNLVLKEFLEKNFKKTVNKTLILLAL